MCAGGPVKLLISNTRKEAKKKLTKLQRTKHFSYAFYTKKFNLDLSDVFKRNKLFTDWQIMTFFSFVHCTVHHRAAAVALETLETFESFETVFIIFIILTVFSLIVSHR